ncbi:LUD domain-containing protein [Halobacteriales archaeon Cl-PHB]
MSPHLETLRQSLSSVGVESTTVSPGGLAEALEEAVVGDAVGIPADGLQTQPGTLTWDPTPADLWEAKTGVTPAAFAIADYGSLVLPTDPPACELVSLYVDRHVAVLDAANVVPDMPAAFDRLDDSIPAAYEDAIVATGPSATADMGELVQGAHGPSEVRVVVVEGEY